ncbi:MAG TPA: helix-turn-helix transcriptional regulator [Bacteroidales bacterium]|nr:helix-turn-helix transcriptional regulator [Bacteroidales bacterium]HNW97529.1 helix-turn-helix transcriptional regulator [Bacteroidales bacterium]
MHVGKNIKKIREEKGLMQKEIAAAAGMHPANYNKVEKGEREPSIEALDKIAKLFGMTIDQLIHFEGKMPKEVTIKDKTIIEQMKLIQELDEKDKAVIFSMIETMLTKKKFKDFFKENVKQ